MKKISILVIALLLIFSFVACKNEPLTPKKVWDGTANTEWYDESKTEYTISSEEDFAGFAKLVNEGKTFEGKKVMLSADIDLDNKPWTPIGHASESVYELNSKNELANIYKSKDTEFKLFAGEFDGQNHKVCNLVIDKTGKANEFIAVALFGVIKNGSTIKNLTIENANVKGDYFTATLLGYVPEENTPTTKKTIIENISLQGDITVYGFASSGGMIGRNEVKTVLEVKNSKINASAKSSVSLIDNGLMVGGLIGAAYGQDTLIENCSSNINVTGNVQVVGGLAGHMQDGTINKSVVSGNIKLIPDKTATKTNWGYDQYGIGAYIGTVDNTAIDTTVNDKAPVATSNKISITNCTSTAKIDTKVYDGEPLFFKGLVGTIRNTKAKSTYNSVDAKNIVTITE